MAPNKALRCRWAFLHTYMHIYTYTNTHMYAHGALRPVGFIKKWRFVEKHYCGQKNEQKKRGANKRGTLD